MWIDGDACPRAAKDLVFRAAKRLKVATYLVANSGMRMPKSPWIELVIVDTGFDEADNHIADNVAEGDVVITADIPLAARIVARGAVGLDPRGLVFSEDNVNERLTTRNLLADLRDAGMTGGGPPPFGEKDRNRFASALDRLLTSLLKSAT